MSKSDQLTHADQNEVRDTFGLRLGEASIAAAELATIYLGHRLNLYRSIADQGSLTASELATHAYVHPRYA